MDNTAIRLFLQAKLEQVFPDMTVYYRPSGNIPLERPCIVYEPKEEEPSFAGNKTYVVGTRFQITILSDLPGMVDRRDMFDIKNVMVVNNNSFVTEDIVHDVFTVSVGTIS